MLLRKKNLPSVAASRLCARLMFSSTWTTGWINQTRQSHLLQVLAIEMFACMHGFKGRVAQDLLQPLRCMREYMYGSREGLCRT